MSETESDFAPNQPANYLDGYRSFTAEDLFRMAAELQRDAPLFFDVRVVDLRDDRCAAEIMRERELLEQGEIYCTLPIRHRGGCRFETVSRWDLENASEGPLVPRCLRRHPPLRGRGYDEMSLDDFPYQPLRPPNA